MSIRVLENADVKVGCEISKFATKCKGFIQLHFLPIFGEIKIYIWHYTCACLGRLYSFLARLDRRIIGTT